MATARRTRSGVQDQVRTLIRRVRELADGMDRETFNRRPSPDSWSVAECLDHLNETARAYLPEFADAIDRARADGAVADPGAPDRTMLGRLIAWTQESGQFRTRTHPALEPARDHDPEDVLEAFEALHEELIVRINEAADLDRRKVRLRSLVDPRLKLSLGDWFHYMAAHARRHLAQAERARARVTAPPSS